MFRGGHAARNPTVHMVKRSEEIYKQLISRIFSNHYSVGITSFEFKRDEVVKVARELGIRLPKNIGDLVYSFRYRRNLPEEILKKAPKGKNWIIVGAGISRYRFQLVTLSEIIPRADMAPIKIPNATPEIIEKYALSDEQALLAKVRYNRLIDIFLGVTAYSLQNHLRTTVKGIGQIEIDELYVGVNKTGTHFIIPVQAKGGSDKLAVIQTMQDFEFCTTKFEELVCRPVGVQFMQDDVIAMFELTLQENEVKVLLERHYKLVPAKQISGTDLKNYRSRR